MIYLLASEAFHSFTKFWAVTEKMLFGKAIHNGSEGQGQPRPSETFEYVTGISSWLVTFTFVEGFENLWKSQANKCN